MYFVTKQLNTGSRWEWVRTVCLLLGLAPPTTYREPCGPSFMKALGIMSKHLMTSCLDGGLACVQAFRASNSTGASLWLVVIGCESVLRYCGVGAKVGRLQVEFERLCIQNRISGFDLGLRATQINREFRWRSEAEHRRTCSTTYSWVVRLGFLTEAESCTHRQFLGSHRGVRDACPRTYSFFARQAQQQYSAARLTVQVKYKERQVRQCKAQDRQFTLSKATLSATRAAAETGEK